MRTLVPVFFWETYSILVRSRISSRHHQLGPFKGPSYNRPPEVPCSPFYETLFFARARHGPGISNDVADALSRFQTNVAGVVSQGAKKNLYHPAFTNDPLTQEVQTYAKWGLAWTTNRTYRSGENRFIQFCLSNRLMSQEGGILSASEGTLIYFASYLAWTFKHSTIKRPCA